MTMSQLAPSTLSSIIRRCVSRGAAADARLLSSLAAQTSTHAHAYSTFVTAHGSELVGSSCPTSNGQHHAVACMCPSCVRSMMCASSSGASRHPFASRAYASAADAGKTAADQRDAKASTSNQQEPSTDKDARSSSGKAAEGAESSGSEPEATPEELMAQLKEQEAAAGKLTEQVSQLTDSLKRALAEMENVRARTAREMDGAKKFAVQGFVKAVLDVADNLERAAAAVPKDALADERDPEKLRALLKGLVEGVNATERILLHAFKMNGVEQYNPEGDKFDPNLHNALFQVPDATKEVGTVAVVTKRGYKLHDRVVRPAEVGVVRAP